MNFNRNQFWSFYLLYILAFLLLFNNSQTLQLTAGWKLITPSHSSLNESRQIDPGPRTGSSLWTTKEGITFLFGGRGLERKNNDSELSVVLLADLWSYNSTSNKWTSFIDYQATHYNDSDLSIDESKQRPLGREMAAMCGSKNGERIVIFGGRIFNRTDQNTCTTTAELLVFNNSKILSWEIHQTNNGPSARFDSLYWCDDESDTMRLVGGKTPDGQLIDDAWKLHLTNLSWVQLSSKQEDSDSGLHGVDKSALLWKLSDGSLFLMRDKTEETNSNNSDFIVQLWKHQASSSNNNSDHWLLISESNQGKITWPGVHRHGGTCTDLDGNLWLFNGESEIDGQLYLNNDLWIYNVTNNMWSKVEVTSSSRQPKQRHLSATWCHQNTLYTYGGSGCTELSCSSLHANSNIDCLFGDLWILNIKTNNDMEINNHTTNHESQSFNVTLKPMTTKSPKIVNKSPEIVVVHPVPPVYKILKQKPKHKIISNAIPHIEITTTAIPTTTTVLGTKSPDKPSNGTIIGISITTAPNSGDAPSSAVFNRKLNRPSSAAAADSEDQPSMIAVESDESANHEVYGSAIFFGISITMFSLFGLVIFFRRCVSCPPRENLLLKEPPPVRYTVIPDDSYSI